MIYFSTMGSCILCLIGWLSGDWIALSLMCSLPMMVVYFGWRLVPESPRWLLSRVGRVKESCKIFNQIAKANKQPPPPDLDTRLQEINNKILETQKNTYGYISLFTHWGLAWKFIVLCVALSSSTFTYHSLALNLGNMGGSFFLNMFVLTIMELPATYMSTLAAVSAIYFWLQTVLVL